jgi:hypothetical protein
VDQVFLLAVEDESGFTLESGAVQHMKLPGGLGLIARLLQGSDLPAAGR